MLSLFEKKYKYAALDIGSTSIKYAKISRHTDGSLELQDYIILPIRSDAFNQNSIIKTDYVAEVIKNGISSKIAKDEIVVTAVPASSVFTKKHRIPLMDFSEIREHIEFEAGSFIPHGADNVCLDFHLIGKSGKSNLEILVVAVRKEIVEKYLEVIELAGLTTGILDVEQFALQNIFEFNYPKLISKTYALVNLGFRSTAVSICRGGQSLFAGDISIGCKNLVDELSKELSISAKDAEKMVVGEPTEQTSSIRLEFVKHYASELARQLSYFWNASGAEGAVDGIFLTGGGITQSNLIEEVERETGSTCQVLDPLSNFTLSKDLESSITASVRNQLSVALSLSMRVMGDKVYEEV